MAQDHFNRLFVRLQEPPSVNTSTTPTSSSVPDKKVRSESVIAHKRFTKTRKVRDYQKRKSDYDEDSDEDSTSSHRRLKHDLVKKRFPHFRTTSRSSKGRIRSRRGGRTKTAKNIFSSNYLQKTSYKAWKKEAKSQLPSTQDHFDEKKKSMLRMRATITEHHHDHDTVPATFRPKKVTHDDDEESEMSSFLSFHKARRTFASTAIPKGKRTSIRMLLGESDSMIESSSELRSSDLEKRHRKAEKEKKEEESLEDLGENVRERIKELKELAEPLSKRKATRKELLLSIAGENPTLADQDISFKEFVLNCAHCISVVYHDVLRVFTIWEKDIKMINSRYGIVISSYFEWLRRLVKLNILTFIISLCFIILPEFIADQFGSEGAVDAHLEGEFHITDIIHGGGSLSKSFLYYSGYHKRTDDFLFDDAAQRFIVAMLFIFILHTKVVFSLIRMHYSSVQMETRVVGVAKVETVKNVICAWDFSCGDPTAAITLHKIIRHDLYILSRGHSNARELAEITTDPNYKLLAYLVGKHGLRRGNLLMRLISNVALLVSTFILGITLFFLFKSKLDYYLNCIQKRDDKTFKRDLKFNSYCPNGDTYLRPVIMSLPAVFTSILSLVLTKFIITVGEMEFFEKPETKVYATMIKAGIFNLTSISVFYFFWLFKTTDMTEQGYVAETVLGEEMYRLVLIQGILDVVINLDVQFLVHFIRRLRNPAYKKPKFQPEYAAQEIFYLDSIARLGTLFCPPISLLVTIRLVICFYQNKYDLMNFCSQETSIARANSVFAPYLVTFFISYIVTSAFLGAYLTEVQPSVFDGPFTEYRRSYAQALTVFLEHKKYTKWMKQLSGRGFIVVLLSILVALVYVCREWAQSYRPLEEQISEHIMFEREDKELLLKAYFEIARVTEKTPTRKTGEEVVDETDEKIDQLIAHAKRKQSVDKNIFDRFHRPSHFVAGGLHAHHRHHHAHYRHKMETLVKEIVQERQRRKGFAQLDIPSSPLMDQLRRKYENTIQLRAAKSQKSKKLMSRENSIAQDSETNEGMSDVD